LRWTISLDDSAATRRVVLFYAPPEVGFGS